MFPTKINILLEQRNNVFSSTGKEWVLFFIFDDVTSSRWAIHTWETMPSQTEIKQAVKIAKRAIDCYYQSIKLPPLDIQIEGDSTMIKNLGL